MFQKRNLGNTGTNISQTGFPQCQPTNSDKALNVNSLMAEQRSEDVSGRFQ